MLVRLVAAGAVMLLLSAMAVAADAEKYWVFFGCYTGTKASESRGISRSQFDPKTGSLSEPVTVAEITNPSFLWVHPNGKNLYCVGEINGPQGKGGGVHAFSLDAKTGQITKRNDMSTGGAGPCHVSVSPDGTLAVAANYSGGSCAFYSLKSTGELAARTFFSQHEGTTGPNKQRQEKAHAHCGYFHPNGKFAYVCDLGLDRVMVYSAAEAAAKLNGLRPAPIVLPPGSGPRHLALAPKGDWMFVNGELDSTCNVVKLDPATGTGSVVQSISTLPGGKPVAGNTTAEVVYHPNGKFVYVSNRGHNSIAAFGWDGSKLTALGHATDGIKIPRNFNLDPTGRWMLVANQDGNNVKVFSIGTDGIPQPTPVSVAVGKPVCVKFVPVTP